MVRPTQLTHPPREIVAPRPAATVLLLRDSTHPDKPGIEVLMTRRSATASFAPGAYVFPGGGIDAADHAAHAQATRRDGQSPEHLTQAIAAIRESYEELGILLALHSNGHRVSPEEVATLRRDLPLLPQCRERGWLLDAQKVFVLAHWVTDRDLPKRFDVPFLVARMPTGQEPVADETEQFEPIWVRPADALERHKARDFFMIFPTIRTLERLLPFANVQAVLDACAKDESPLWTSCPRAGTVSGKEVRFMESDPPFGELALVCPDGQMDHALDWQNETPVPLLRNVKRLTSGNPGVMTGPGTNSYVIGDPATGHIVIDPGPDDPEHIYRLWRAAGGDIRAIVCTHSHPDHFPGAPRLQDLCASAGLGRPPVLGLSSAPTAREHSRFRPERELQDGERLVLEPSTDSSELERQRHTLLVVHTPGHAANHVCLVLEEDGLLFSGDHVLNGSTTLIDPPDGNMGDYLGSLDRLSELCDQYHIDFILPAHGHVLGDLRPEAGNPHGIPGGGAKAAIAHLRAHRLKREAKVAQAMSDLPEGTLDDWVRVAYDDVPERLWPVAKRSMLAHVEHIESLGGFNG